VRFADASVLGREDGWLHAPWITRPQATPRLAWTRHRLLQALQDHDAHAAEYWAGFAASALAHDTSGTRGRYTLASRELDAVIAVCDAVRADPAWRASIAERAHVVHCTAAQLTRAFRRALGMAPHQFVRRERLRHAASLLAAGESVSRTCYASGFDNLSHFVRSFRREFGLTPSQWRTNGPTALRRQIDGKVQAERVPLR
jgi:AraC-like DNA-binding protein